MIVYKAVAVSANGKRVSYNKNVPKRFRIWYRIGVEVEPKAGKCLAFETPGAAELFVKHKMLSPYRRREIWEAETPEAKPIERLASDNYYNLLRFLRKFWKGEVILNTLTAPEGTVACPSLKLVKKVRDYG